MFKYQDSRFKDLQVETLFSTENRWQAWLDVEAALAQSQAALGIIPQDAAAAIVENAKLALLDRDEIERAYKRTSHILVALVWTLSKRVGDKHGGWIHWGATTQNIVATGDVLLIKRAHQLIRGLIEDTLEAMADLAELGADMPMAGRTHGQHAVPITFGAKVAGWIDELLRHLQRLDQAAPRSLVVTLGGAVGTYASLEQGPELEVEVARRLGLHTRGVPSRAIRDGAVENVLNLALLASTCSRISREIFNLMRTEYGEAEEPVPDGVVGSSTMAQKKNPRLAHGIISLAADIRAQVGLALESNQTDHESDGMTILMIQPAEMRSYIAAEGMMVRMVETMRGLILRPQRMLDNLKLADGLIMAEAVVLELGRSIGRQIAHDVVYDISQKCLKGEGNFSTLLSAHPNVGDHLNKTQIEQLLDPTAHVASSSRMAYEAVRRVRSGEHRIPASSL